jgi:hypothetical protein
MNRNEPLNPPTGKPQLIPAVVFDVNGGTRLFKPMRQWALGLKIQVLALYAIVQHQVYITCLQRVALDL